MISKKTTQEPVTATGLAPEQQSLRPFSLENYTGKSADTLAFEVDPELDNIYFSWKSNYFIAASQMEKKYLKTEQNHLGNTLIKIRNN